MAATPADHGSQLCSSTPTTGAGNPLADWLTGYIKVYHRCWFLRRFGAAHEKIESDAGTLPGPARRSQMPDTQPMENRDLSIIRQLLALMALKPGARVLHLNCGDGWATRMAAQVVSGATGMAAGLDISQDRIAQARAEARDLDNVLFAVGAAEEIPWRDEFFDGIFSLESFSGGTQEAALREAHRVLVSGGRLYFLAVGGEESTHRHLLQAGGFVEIACAGLSGSPNGALLWMASKP